MARPKKLYEDSCVIHFTIRADIHEKIKQYLQPYGGSMSDFARRACFHELERVMANESYPVRQPPFRVKEKVNG